MRLKRTRVVCDRRGAEKKGGGGESGREEMRRQGKEVLFNQTADIERCLMSKPSGMQRHAVSFPLSLFLSLSGFHYLSFITGDRSGSYLFLHLVLSAL